MEFLREAVGVVGREVREELALRSSELRLSEASLSPLLMELLSSQLQDGREKGQPAPGRPGRRGSRCGAMPGAGTHWPDGEGLRVRPRCAGHASDVNCLVSHVLL